MVKVEDLQGFLDEFCYWADEYTALKANNIEIPEELKKSYEELRQECQYFIDNY